jgi:peptide/nickel transport system substrate-binding protein
MRSFNTLLGKLVVLLASTILTGTGNAASPEKVVTITSQATLTTSNPYAESETQMYFIWCQIYGCLGRIDYVTKELKPMIAESWEVIDPHTWRFKIRTDLKRQDGGPGPTARDVVHSWKRIMEDPESAQRFNMFEVKEMVAVDEHTVDIKTKDPSGQLLYDLFSQFEITSADLYEKYGKDADRQHAIGWGPYKFESLDIDQRLVMRKSDVWPEKRPKAPDVVIYRQMREAQQRVTAVLNNEVQVARQIPPELVDRFKGQSQVTILPTKSVELMMLAFNYKMKPWDDIRIRRAAAYAINRDLIIQKLLFGYADRLDGPLGPAQVCYKAPAPHAIGYDVKKAKELLAEAGYPNGGPEIELQGSTGRYISDRQIVEALAQMLKQVGFKVKLVTPEWANLWSDVRNGKSPAFYMGRAQALDPSIMLSQYFQTGGTPRTGYSDPKLDVILDKVRTTFNADERCGLIHEAVDKIAADVPAQFLWTHRLIDAVRSNITFPADPSGDAWWLDVVVN